MTIGIDIRVLGYHVKSGIEEYAENLMPKLIKEGESAGVNFKLFFSSRINNLPDYNWLRAKNVKLYKFSYSNSILFASSKFLNKPFIDKIVGGADVFFFPHFFLSSLSPSCKRVTTFHDLSFLYYPEFLTLRKKIWHNLQMNPNWQAKFSDKIIAVSESTKNDLVSFYKIDPARIEVIYSGINVEDAPPQERGASSVAAFKRTKNLPDRFILYLGKLEPRKNIVSVVKAFNNLRSNQKYEDVGLVIAGAKGWKYEDIFKEAGISNRQDLYRQVLPVAEKIIFTGQLTDKERFLYYHAADIFVYPSFFEGFGFPPLEAISCGTPVITSRNSSLPEIVGDAAIMVDPYNVGELELWISKLLEDKNLKMTLISKGKERVNIFDWQITAQKTLEYLVR